MGRMVLPVLGTMLRVTGPPKLLTGTPEALSTSTTTAGIIAVFTCVVLGGTLNTSMVSSWFAAAGSAVSAPSVSTTAAATVTGKLPSKNRVIDRIIASSSATSVPSQRASRVLQRVRDQANTAGLGTGRPR